MRLDEKVKAKAEKAAALLGLKSLTEYVVILARWYRCQRYSCQPVVSLTDAALLEYLQFWN